MTRVALWKYVIELPGGAREERMLAAGNRDAARARAEAHAQAIGARVASDLEAVDPVRGTM